MRAGSDSTHGLAGDLPSMRPTSIGGGARNTTCSLSTSSTSIARRRRSVRTRSNSGSPMWSSGPPASSCWSTTSHGPSCTTATSEPCSAEASAQSCSHPAHSRSGGISSPRTSRSPPVSTPHPSIVQPWVLTNRSGSSRLRLAMPRLVIRALESPKNPIRGASERCWASVCSTKRCHCSAASRSTASAGRTAALTTMISAAVATMDPTAIGPAVRGREGRSPRRIGPSNHRTDRCAAPSTNGRAISSRTSAGNDESWPNHSSTG